MFRRIPGIYCATLLLIMGCSDVDRDKNEILRTLALRTDALNSRDISRYLSVVSPRYHDKGMNFEQLAAGLELNFKSAAQLSYLPETPAITVTGTTARSVTAYRMKILAGGKEIKLNGTEHLTLVKEPGGWKIIAGI